MSGQSVLTVAGGSAGRAAAAAERVSLYGDSTSDYVRLSRGLPRGSQVGESFGKHSFDCLPRFGFSSGAFGGHVDFH